MRKTVTTLLAILLTTCSAMSQTPIEATTKTPRREYLLDPSWPNLPEGLRLGQVTGVAVNSKNQVFVFHGSDRTWSPRRSMTFIQGHTICVFEGKTGEYVKKFGEDRFVLPHGLSIGPDDDVLARMLA